MKKKEPNLAKRMPPLGPLPRYIWIHQATPPDSLDKVCYDIWRRTQNLPDGLKPKNASLVPEKAKKVNVEHRVEPLTDEKDDIIRLVEQEYMNLIMENLFDCFRTEPTNENNDIEKERKVQVLGSERMIKSLPFTKHSPGKSLPSKRRCQNRFAVKNTTTKQDSCNTDNCKAEGQNLFVQNPVKTAETLRATPTATLIGSNVKTNDIPVKLTSDIPRTENQRKENGMRLPVFVKLCKKMQVPKTHKPPSGFANISRGSCFPGLVRPRQSVLEFNTSLSSMIVGAIKYSYCLGFLHPVPVQSSFPGQRQANVLRTAPIPFVQSLQTQFYPVTPQQDAHHLFHLPYVPQGNNFQHLRPNIFYKHRNAPKPTFNIKDLPPMVFNRQQYQHYAYRFNHSMTRTALNRAYDSSVANCMKPL